jgi:hypothetical protein
VGGCVAAGWTSQRPYRHSTTSPTWLPSDTTIKPFLRRVWELRHNLTVYGALHVALAEALDAPLITCDVRLARAPVDSVAIELILPGS